MYTRASIFSFILAISLLGVPSLVAHGGGHGGGGHEKSSKPPEAQHKNQNLKKNEPKNEHRNYNNPQHDRRGYYDHHGNWNEWNEGYEANPIITPVVGPTQANPVVEPVVIPVQTVPTQTNQNTPSSSQ